MLKRPFRAGFVASLLVLTVGLAACSSDDDDDTTDDTPVVDAGDDTDTGDGTDAGETSEPADDNIVTLSLALDSESTVPPANVPGASGTGSVTVDTDTGAISGSVTVSGTTGQPTIAHVHEGGVGESGPIVITMEGNEDGTVWTIPEGSALDAVGIQNFNDGLLYINVHTEANAPGELRTQLVDANTPAAGSVTITFRNLAENQPMTPPVVALHTAQGDSGGIRLFEVGQPAIDQVREIAENGNNTPLVDVAVGQIAAGTVSDAGVAAPEEGGPLLPGATSSITLMPELPDQVLSIVAMVVCTNDGFTGVDSISIEEGTFTAPIYDAGTETNILTLDYWVPTCSDGSVTDNFTDTEGGVITAHPGQSGSENAAFDFEAGSEFLEITVTVN